jgi:hypothetical protein
MRHSAFGRSNSDHFRGPQFARPHKYQGRELQREHRHRVPAVMEAKVGIEPAYTALQAAA